MTMRSTSTRRLRVIAAAMALVLLAGLLACRSTKQNLNKRDEPAPAPAPTTQSPFDLVESKLIESSLPFDHNRKEHKTKTQDCAFCHQRANNDPTPVFPSHGACLECHQKDFNNPAIKDVNNPASKMCAVCHKTPFDAQATRISFPGRQEQFGIKSFSHRDHANPEKMKGQMDASLMPSGAPRCESCHRFDSSGLAASFPRHPDCYSCHAHQPGGKFSECGACHAKKTEAMQYSAALGPAFKLYNFRHGSHLKTASCDKCHQSTEVAARQVRADIGEINTAKGQQHHSACFRCHVNAKEPVCTKCHVGSLPF